MRQITQNMESAVKDTEKMIWREEGQKYLFQAKRVLILRYHRILSLAKTTADLYTLCPKKNDTDVTHYRFNPHQPISVIFGRDVAERVCY